MQNTFNTQQFNYKGLEIIANDILVSKEFSTVSGFCKREWKIDGKEAHTFNVNDNTYLAFYREGEVTRTILSEFKPNCGFHIDLETEKKVVSEAGLSLEHTIKEY